MKKCSYCAEEIKDEAIKCRYCGSSLESLTTKIDKKIKPIKEQLKETSEKENREWEAELGKFDYSNIKIYKCKVKNRNGVISRHIVKAHNVDKLKEKFLEKDTILLKNKLIKYKGKYPCPRCRSYYTKRYLFQNEKIANIFIILCFLSGGILVPIFLICAFIAGIKYKCKICNYTWTWGRHQKISEEVEKERIKKNKEIKRFCPKCSREYDGNWTICLYCSVPLE